MKLFCKTDVGEKRKVNQDYVYATDRPVGNIPNLFIVADGMGGHKAGDYASKHATEKVIEQIQCSNQKAPEAIMREAIQMANYDLIEKATEDICLEGMGTTLIVATVIEHTLYFANVGDSRVYLINKEIRQLSKDHSLVGEMIRLGGLKEDEAKNHPDKNIITRAVGVKQELEIDFFEFCLGEGDKILMCTDGLSNMLEDVDLFCTIQGSRDMVEAVQLLIARANENGGRDNIGVVLFEPFAGEVNI